MNCKHFRDLQSILVAGVFALMTLIAALLPNEQDVNDETTSKNVLVPCKPKQMKAKIN